jgi:hypothetical protein
MAKRKYYNFGSNKKMSVRERKRLIKFLKGASLKTITKKLKSNSCTPDILRSELWCFERHEKSQKLVDAFVGKMLTTNKLSD